MTDSLIVISIMAVFYAANGVVIRLGHKPQTTLEEYGVAGRSMNWLMVCFSYMGGWYVGATYTGWFAFSADLGLFAQYIIIYSTAGLVILYLMAKPVWSWGKEYGLETQADIIELRYNSKPFAMVFAVLVGVISSTWLVVEMVTLGYIVSAATNQSVSFDLGVVVLGAGVILYSLLGGARASAVGALFQGVTFTIIGTLTFYVLIVKSYGGVVPLMELVERNKPDLLVLDPEKGLDMLWMSAILTGTFGAFCWPPIFSRMYMSSSPRETKKAVFIAPFAALAIALVLLWLALGARMIPGFPEDGQSGVFWMAQHFGGPLALGLVGVFASAAAVSTISANVNASAVLLSKNLLGSVIQREETILKSAKIITAVLGGVAIFIATFDLPKLIVIALGMYDCIVQVIVPLLLGMFWKRGNMIGAVSGLVVGIVVAVASLIWPSLIAWTGGISGGLVGLALNAVVYIACGFVFGTQPHTEKIFNILNQYNDEGEKLTPSSGSSSVAAAPAE